MEEKALMVLPDNLNGIMQSAPNILTNNRNSVESAKQFGSTLLSKFDSGMNEELYNQGLSYISKVRKTVAKINESRKPVTQIIAEVAKLFTSLEADLDEKRPDTVPFKIQSKLNVYANEQLRRKQEEEQKAKAKLERENALVEIKAEIESKLNQFFFEKMRNDVQQLNKYWATITLDTFEEITTDILNISTGITEADFSKFNFNTFNKHVDRSDIVILIKEVLANKLPEYTKTFSETYDCRKHEIVECFSSKYLELVDISKIAEKNKEEAERLKQIAVEREKKAQEVTEKQAQTTLNNLNTQTEVSKSTAKMDNLFSASSSITTPAIKVKETTEVEVKNVAGWMAIVSFWFEKEAINLSADQMEKKFGFARKFAETHFNKSGESIKSPHIIYKGVAKAK